MIDTVEELEIIAKDGKSLDAHDREVIVQAVNELKAMERELLSMRKALRDSQIVRDQLSAQVEAALKPFWPPRVWRQGPWQMGVSR